MTIPQTEMSKIEVTDNKGVATNSITGIAGKNRTKSITAFKSKPAPANKTPITKKKTLNNNTAPKNRNRLIKNILNIMSSYPYVCICRAKIYLGRITIF